VLRVAGHAIELELSAEPSTPRIVRRAFAAHFAEQPRLEEMLLCVSEVVTNAVLYAGSAIKVTAAMVLDGRVRVEVSDGSVVQPTKRLVTRLSTTGRGLHLLDQLALDWGVEVTAVGKTVWFEIAGVAS
jgi:anti-sigma regulatory factor (Ser/Thr protein kinase)